MESASTSEETMANNKVIDYTAMPLGKKIHGGEIKACPKCGRIGLASPGRNGTTNYLHKLGATGEIGSGDNSPDFTLHLKEDECDVVPEVPELPPQE
jgi:hypothetical protein